MIDLSVFLAMKIIFPAMKIIFLAIKLLKKIFCFAMKSFYLAMKIFFLAIKLLRKSDFLVLYSITKFPLQTTKCVNRSVDEDFERNRSGDHGVHRALSAGKHCLS